MIIRYVLCILFLSLKSITGLSQENIPLGTWRTHASFRSVQHIATGDSKIFAASASNILQVDLSDNSFFTYSTLNALSSTDISVIAFDDTRKQLLVAYSDGTLDLISENFVINFTQLVNPSGISTSSRIHHIFINEHLAYLSTNYGVVVFDLMLKEIRETWQNLGTSGELLSVYGTAVKNDSIYLATANGFLAGNINDNLLNFKQWNRYSTGVIINHITVFKNKIYAAVNSLGVFYFTGLSWQKKENLPIAAQYNFLKGYSNTLFIGGDGHVWETNINEGTIEITDPLITNPQDIVLFNNARWITDNSSGLLSDRSGAWTTYIPNGPSSSFVFRSKMINNKIYVTHGGFQPTLSNIPVSVFEKGMWSELVPHINNISDIEQRSDQSLCISSFGYGLEIIDKGGNFKIFNSVNSPLENMSGDNTTYVSAIEKTSDKIWVANFGVFHSLHTLQADNTWTSFSFPGSYSQYPFELVVDFIGNIWMLLAPNGGGGILVVNEEGTVQKYITEQQEAGFLPSKNVLCATVDRNGYVWVGTTKGVAYFISYEEDAIRPITEGRFLLTDERIQAIAVDGGNRKWIGTENGAWLFDAAGETLIYHFTTENSPLPSNRIVHIETDDENGEVFIATDKGLVSFRADATSGSETFNAIKIFPNPIPKNFSGQVGITGLYTDAVVKITDAGGTLVRELQANGGIASWDVRHANGNRVATGVYVIIASAADGSESAAGKVIVVD